MISLVDRWSIVIAGLWNPHIFSPEWVAKNMLQKGDHDEIQIQIALGPGVAQKVRLVSDNVTIALMSERIQFHPKQPIDADVQSIENVALRTIDLLPHTPLSGYGVNFSFLEKDASSIDLELFDANDYPDLAELGFEPSRRQIVRILRVDPTCTLNLTFGSDGESEQPYVFDFNFHHQATKEGKIDTAQIRGKAVAYKNRALGILEKVYGLTLQEESEEND